MANQQGQMGSTVRRLYNGRLRLAAHLGIMFNLFLVHFCTRHNNIMRCTIVPWLNVKLLT